MKYPKLVLVALIFFVVAQAALTQSQHRIYHKLAHLSTSLDPNGYDQVADSYFRSLAAHSSRTQLSGDSRLRVRAKSADEADEAAEAKAAKDEEAMEKFSKVRMPIYTPPVLNNGRRDIAEKNHFLFDNHAVVDPFVIRMHQRLNRKSERFRLPMVVPPTPKPSIRIRRSRMAERKISIQDLLKSTRITNAELDAPRVRPYVPKPTVAPRRPSPIKLPERSPEEKAQGQPFTKQQVLDMMMRDRTIEEQELDARLVESLTYPTLAPIAEVPRTTNRFGTLARRNDLGQIVANIQGPVVQVYKIQPVPRSTPWALIAPEGADTKMNRDGTHDGEIKSVDNYPLLPVTMPGLEKGGASGAAAPAAAGADAAASSPSADAPAADAAPAAE